MMALCAMLSLENEYEFLVLARIINKYSRFKKLYLI